MVADRMKIVLGSSWSVSEREREYVREGGREGVKEHERGKKKEGVISYVPFKEKERRRERESRREGESERECVCERETVKVSVCVRERVKESV